MLIGYARDSTIDQNLALQRDALTEAGCEKIFIEQKSGAVTDRPELMAALGFMRGGDTLVVWKVDRLFAAAYGLALLAAFGGAAPTRADGLAPAAKSRLCVTEGALESSSEGRLFVNVAKLRAVLAAPGRQEIEARFVYLGPTAETAPLRSGAIRRQFGLKLRAADGCNLIYVMWRFAPEPALVVSVKSNFGLHASRACGAAGYRNVAPQRQAPVEAPEIGVPHRLAAALDGEALRVRIDGMEVWEGEVGHDALAVDGPVGIRSDNVRLELELFAAPTTPQGACPKVGGAAPEE